MSRRELLKGAPLVVLAAAGVELGFKLTGSSTKPLPPSRFGANAGTEPFPNDDGHFALEQLLGAKLPTMLWYQYWDTGWLSGPATSARDTGHNILLTWQPELGSLPTPIPFDEILAGKYDDYANTMFQAIAASGVEVAMRPMHEMNGNFYPWSVNAPNSAVTSTDQWIQVWRKLVSMQRAFGGSVRWVWCPNFQDSGGDSPVAEDYWPGGDVVDVLGIDVYNGIEDIPWQTPSQLTSPMLGRVRSLAPTLPVWLCEVGCREAQPSEAPNTKAQWLAKLGTYAVQANLPNVVFFDHDQWNLDTSPASLAAAKQVVRTTPLTGSADQGA